jgi:cytochrome c biogenesis protein ResB
LFTAGWFITLLGLLAASVAACTNRRLVTARTATGSVRRRAMGSMLTHISLLLILSGAVIRAIWGEKGFIEMREGQTLTEFQTDKGVRPLPFSIALTDFRIDRDAPANRAAAALAEKAPKAAHDELLVQWSERGVSARLPVTLNVEQTLTPANEAATSNNTFHITALKYFPDFTVNTDTREVSTRSSEPNNPALLVAVNGPGYRNHTWLFAKFPNFSMKTEGSATNSPLRLTFVAQTTSAKAAPAGAVKNYQSTVNLLEGGKVAQAATIAVNSPLKYKGYRFYQTGYNPDDLAWTSLEVVRDPGVPVIYTGFCFLIAGLFIVFYLNPWLTSHQAKP